MDEMPGFTVDFLSFEVLPADAATTRLLDMSPHPGAKVVDGAAIDAAEARHDTAEGRDRTAPRPTPTPVRQLGSEEAVAPRRLETSGPRVRFLADRRCLGSMDGALCKEARCAKGHHVRAVVR